MKWKAVILMVCLVAWFAETLATVKIICPVTVSVQRKTCSKTSCSKMMHSGMQIKCSSKSSKKKDKKGGTCNDAASCLNCPLCFVSTLDGALTIDKPEIAAGKKYPMIHFSHPAGFPGISWKPPDSRIA